MKKLLIGFILGGIAFGSIGIYAASYLASDISYTKGGVETNVNDALDELYVKTNEVPSKNVYEVTSGQGNTTISLTSLGLTDTNADNYILQVTSIPDAGGVYVGWIDQDNQYPHLIGSTPTLEIIDGNIVISGMECKGGHKAANVYATTQIEWKLYHF